jgi:multisubunit Na+/H+ antiporter MnhC subunit
MALIGSLLVGVMAAAGVFLLLRRKVFDVLLGALLLSHAVNLAILVGGGWAAEAKPALLQEKPVPVETADGVLTKISQIPAETYMDPVPPALILTAIVIGLALMSFLTGLAVRTSEAEEAGH